MPIGLNVDNPQEQLSSQPVSPTSIVSYGGNALGTGASTATSASTSSINWSTIITYGVIALVVIFILKRLDL